MKKAIATILLFCSFSAWAENSLPPLGPRSLLKYYTGEYNGTKVMEFGYICSRADEGLRVVRNEIMAKYGRPFKSIDLREHFEKTSWYAANPAYHDGLLTAIDNENIRRVQAVENGLSGGTPFLRDVIAGKEIHVEDNAFSLIFDRAKKQVLYVKGKIQSGSYTDKLSFAYNTAQKKIQNTNNLYFIFNYANRYYITIGQAEGMRGDYIAYYTMSFEYNAKSHTINTILVQ